MATYKTLQRPISIVSSVTADEETANAVVLEVVEITSGEVTDEFLWVQEVKRAGVEIPGFKGSYESTSGSLTIADAEAVSLTSGDVVTVMGTFYR